MAEISTGAIALLAIQPQFVERIMSGKKLVEFRKTRFKNPVRCVVIYSSSPVKAIVAFFTVTGVDEGAPDEIWKRFAKDGGVNEEEYQAYFAGSERAFAIKIGDITPLKHPVLMKDIDSHNPPQSFMYLSEATLEKLEISASDRCHIFL